MLVLQYEVFVISEKKEETKVIEVDFKHPHVMDFKRFAECMKEAELQKQLRVYAASYTGALLNATGTTLGTATSPGNAVGPCSGSYARFRSVYNATTNVGQSVLAVYDMGSAVSGSVWICARMASGATGAHFAHAAYAPAVGGPWTSLNFVQIATAPGASPGTY